MLRFRQWNGLVQVQGSMEYGEVSPVKISFHLHNQSVRLDLLPPSSEHNKIADSKTNSSADCNKPDPEGF